MRAAGLQRTKDEAQGDMRAKAPWGDVETVAIQGTLAEAYLRGRGITCPLPVTLRFQARGWHPSAYRLPMMVAWGDGPANRCLVPVTSFVEPKKGGNQWFGPTEQGKPMFFAGIEVRGWQSLRKVKYGPKTDDLFAIPTCTPNAEVGAVHPKAMLAILTEPVEWETWLAAPFEIAVEKATTFG